MIEETNMSFKNFHMLVVPADGLHDDRFKDRHHYDLAVIASSSHDTQYKQKDGKDVVDFPASKFTFNGRELKGSELFAGKYHFDDDIIVVRGRGISDIPKVVSRALIGHVANSYGVTQKTRFCTQPRGHYDLDNLTEHPFNLDDFVERPDDNAGRVEKVCAYFLGLEPYDHVFDWSDLKIDTIVSTVLGVPTKKHEAGQELKSELWKQRLNAESEIKGSGSLYETGPYQSDFARVRADYVVGLLRGAVELAKR